MATDTKRSALEIESWLFDPGEDEQAASKPNSEVAKQQHTGLSETGQPDSKEISPKPKKIRFNPRMISRFL